MLKFLNRLIGNYWTVVPCGWPYPPGYATYNPWKRAILDVGLTKEDAEKICFELNA